MKNVRRLLLIALVAAASALVTGCHLETPPHPPGLPPPPPLPVPGP